MATRKTTKSQAVPTELRQEIATIARDPFSTAWGGIARPRDETLATRGGARGIWIYEDLKRDAAVVRGTQKRVLGLTSRPLIVEAASTSELDVRAADGFRLYAQKARMNRLTKALWDATIKGFAPVECMWKPWRNMLVPLQFKARDQRRFVFDEESNLRMLTREHMIRGIELPSRKFIVHRCGESDENPYGLGLGSQLFWPVLFKRQGISFWLQFVDKLGIPTAVGKYPAGTQPDQQEILRRAIAAIRSSTGVTIPDGMAIDYLQLATTGNVTTQEALVRYMDEQIDGILSLEASGSKGGGALAAAAIDRREVRMDVIKADDEEICETLQSTLCTWFVEINFPGAEPPQLYRDTDEPEDLNARAERDKKLFDMGYRASPDQVKQTYGGDYIDMRAEGGKSPVAPNAMALPSEQRAGRDDGEDDDGASNVEFAASGDGSFPDQVAIDNALDALAAGDLQKMASPIVQPLIDFVRQSRDPLDALNHLAEAYPKIDTGRLEELLARAMFVSMIWGQVSGTQEVAGDA